MDDDDFNSELLGGLQRQRNLQQNEATRQAIEGLREDLKRKEQAEAAAPKCPYCFGAIAYGAVKCRHCASDIAWYKVEEKQYPMKTGEDPQLFKKEKLKELEQKEREAAEKERLAVELNRWRRNRGHKKKAKVTKKRIRFYKCMGLGFVTCLLVGIVMGIVNEELIAAALGIIFGGTIPMGLFFYAFMK
ncbi:MAG: hypothetical protein GY915_01220 [bacterium]|nr:hypothetical protein [bacterium]